MGGPSGPRPKGEVALYGTTWQLEDFDDPASPGLAGATALFCVHFSADGREHGMWFVDCDGPGDDGEPLPRLPAELSARWRVSQRGTPRAEVCRRGDVLCEALLLTEDEKPADPGETRIALSARYVRDVLRAEGLTAQQASMLAGIRQRPLLATVARRAELPPPMARQVHRLLLAALVEGEARARSRRPVAVGA